MSSIHQVGLDLNVEAKEIDWIGVVRTDAADPRRSVDDEIGLVGLDVVEGGFAIEKVHDLGVHRQDGFAARFEMADDGRTDQPGSTCD